MPGRGGYRTKKRKLGYAALGLGTALAAGVVLAQSGAPVPDPRAGAAAYKVTCAACHGGGLEGGPGGPALTGDEFRAKWGAQSQGALAAYLQKSMPPGGEGSLSPSEYASLAAFIMQANGSGVGAAPTSATEEKMNDGHSAAPPETAPPTEPLAVARLDARKRQLDMIRPVTDAMLLDPDKGDWLHWRRTYDGQGYSELAQVNRDNVSRLQAAWSWQLATGDNEITPLVHDGVMFVFSGGRVDALDAVNGEPLWQYTRPGYSGITRNLAIYGEKIFVATGTTMVALDVRTGKVVWEKAIAGPDAKSKVSAGPVVVKGKLLQGMSLCTSPMPEGCYIVALDPETGAEAWRFGTIAMPGQPGGDTWFDTPADKRSGGSVWTTGTYDPELDLVFFGTGQTYQTANLLKGTERAAGLYTDTTLALDPDTGKLVWHFQHQDGDVWDLDWSFERILSRVTVDGKRRKTITTGGKIGLFDTLDAATGKYLFSTDLGAQTLVDWVDPKTGAKHIDPAKVPTPGKTVNFCPGTLGGRNWPATAINPVTQILYVPFNDTCGSLGYNLAPARDGGFKRAPDPEGRVGRVQAIDLKTRKTLWTRRERSPAVSAILSTAGGLIFEGNRDRWFRASDDRTGEILWQMRLNASVSSFPITYSVDGVQYVAVVAGGGNFVDTIIGNLTPEIISPTRQPTLWIFRLPGPAPK